MTSNLLVFVFFALFFLFLAESIYFMRRKLGSTAIDLPGQENNQSAGKYIFIGGLAVVLLITAGAYLFLSAQKTPPENNVASKPNPTDIPTQTQPSPTPNEITYALPPSPTLVAIVTITKIPTPTKTPSPTPTITITPSPTTQPPKPTKQPTGGPIGGPDTVSPTMGQLPTSAAVIIPKLPVAGSVQQTLGIFLLGVSGVLAGLIL